MIPEKRTSWTKPVYLFSGEEDRLKERAIAGIKGSLFSGSEGDLDCSVFYGGESPIKDILASASTVPFFAGRRLVIVKRAERLSPDEKEALAGYLPRIPLTTCLVVEFRDDQALEKLSGASDLCDIIRFEKANSAQFSARAASFFRERGVTIDDEAAAALRDLIGESDEGIREQELEKLSLSVSGRSSILLNDVESLVGVSMAASAFALADAVGARDVAGALGVLRKTAGTQGRSGDAFGIIVWHVRTLLKGRMLFEGGASDYAISSALRLPSRKREVFLAQVKRTKKEEISKKLEMLLSVDLDIKTGRLEPKAALEMVVTRLCLG